MKLFAALLIACSISLVLAQKDDATPQRHRWSADAVLSKVPTEARARTNPFQGNPLEARAGGKLFEQHCAECHGPKAGGTRHAPSLLSTEIWQAPPGSLFWILTNGVVRHGMPVWSKLPEQQRWQLVTFLQSSGIETTDAASR